ncbi:sensor histidine kinase [Clostridium sp. KNHs216]|uniref:sensor histidine kinase n=1 Tax=Clostridium sp. KNHs216 TaxID=1550235 RepID=UPI0011546698|nr:sensor histidine kinase [Clostridium sp. KNHs216]TQI68187.1 signal transduction histidine kinase [Clostridium sp. KNHs216]
MPNNEKTFHHVWGIIHRYKRSFIVLTALLTVLAMMVLIRIPRTASVVTVPVKNGVYDLRELSALKSSSVRLPAPSEYYPGLYLSPDSADTAVPKSIAGYEQDRADYLSQRFVLLMPDTSDTYTLTFTLSGRHAMRVYVNGWPAGQTGALGTAKQDTEVWENNITVHASAVNGRMDIILHSAQFYHARGGAGLAALTVQSSSLDKPRFTDSEAGFFVGGALVCAAVLLLSVYLFLSRTEATFYFAAACLVMALREFVQSQAWIYFSVNGNLVFMLEYMSVVLLTVFLCLYLRQYASTRPLRAICYAAVAGSLAYGLLLLLADSVVYTRLLIVYQLLLIAVIVPGIAGLFRTIRKPDREQSAMLYGTAVFYLAALADILMSNHLLGSGHGVTVSETAMLVFVVAQTVSLFLMNNRVLAESRESERKLAAEKTALESLDRMKTEFLGNVSHELKTPLTVMSGYAQTSKQLTGQMSVPQADEVSRRMTLISSEAERLSLMVGQILDVTRMEEGRMVMEPVRCHLDEIIHAAVKTHYPMLNKNQNRLEIRIEPGLPDICADPARISQVIVNLISNAVRFTTEGVITISAEQKENQLVVCVSDTGVGVAPERLPRLFERYGGKQKSGGGQDTGTGLGLYICKHIVDQHGGTIWLESEEGKGTSVFFTLPYLTANTVPC